ncbi:MAG TPA: arginase family protein [Longimicrobiaceae bacterium]|nr:arginase family protein [Longimicrobiaceae bacterium]
MKVQALLVPYDSGHRDERFGRGPDHLLRHGLASTLRALGHDVKAEYVETDAPFPTEIATTFALHARLSERVRAAVDAGRFPLVLSGNCGSAIGTAAGVGTGGLGVVWLDAHGDLNTPETSASGFLDGMCLATLAGRCWRGPAARIPGFTPVAEQRIVLAARDLDPGERELLQTSLITHLSTEAIRTGALREAVERLARDSERIYLHLDLDVLDTSVGRANSYAVPGGLTAAELADAVATVAATGRLAALGVASYDPTCDENGAVFRAAVAALESLPLA